jgi:hypothetical protein
VAFGHGNRAWADYAMAAGLDNEASGISAVTVGRENSVLSEKGVAIGIKNYTATLGVGMGIRNFTAANSTSFGRDNFSTANNSLSLGTRNYAAAAYAVSIGDSIYNNIPNSLMIGPSDAAKLTILASGNVGIGTIDPAQKLAVNGTIRAKDIIVDTGWSDYVFDRNYRLADLDEVEAHIKAEGHLPGIPSAREVADHGVSLGEMQAMLLAKIEELTLHQIAQAKELSLLKAENAQLRAEMRGTRMAGMADPDPR